MSIHECFLNKDVEIQHLKEFHLWWKKKTKPTERKRGGEETPKWKGTQRKTKEKACQVYSSDCKIFSLAALGEIQLCVLVHALPIRGGVSFATLMFLARGKTVILFSASNVWSVTALKVRGVLWSVGMHQQKRIFLSISYMLYRLLWLLLNAYCLGFFFTGKLIPLHNIKCISNTLCAAVVLVSYSRTA